MKKLVFLLTAAVMLFTACGNSAGDTDTPSGDNSVKNNSIVDDTKDAADDLTDGAGNAIGDAADGAGDAADSLVKGGTDAVRDAADGIEDAMKNEE